MGGGGESPLLTVLQAWHHSGVLRWPPGPPSASSAVLSFIINNKRPPGLPVLLGSLGFNDPSYAGLCSLLIPVMGLMGKWWLAVTDDSGPPCAADEQWIWASVAERSGWMCLLDFQSFSRKARWPGATTQTSQSGALIGFGWFRERETPVGVLADLGKANETMRPRELGPCCLWKNSSLWKPSPWGSRTYGKCHSVSSPSPSKITTDLFPSPIRPEAILFCQYCVAGLPICHWEE